MNLKFDAKELNLIEELCYEELEAIDEIEDASDFPEMDFKERKKLLDLVVSKIINSRVIKA